MYTWAEFNEAVDELLLVNAARLGTESFKEAQVRLAVIRIQRNIEAYRRGQQNIFTADDLTVEGFVSKGSMPEGCTPRDCYLVRRFTVDVSNAVDTATDEVTAADHGITQGTNTAEVQVAQFRNTGGALPTGLVAGRSYFVRVVDADTITLHTSAAGALDNTNRVTVSGDGSGSSFLDWGINRYPASTYPWANRYDLIEGSVCFNAGQALVSFDPNSLYFYVGPIVLAEDSDGKNHYFELNWDGVKIDWDDDEQTTMDEQSTACVAEFVQSQFYRHIDRDLAAAKVCADEFRSQMAGLFVDAKRRLEQRT